MCHKCIFIKQTLEHVYIPDKEIPGTTENELTVKLKDNKWLKLKTLLDTGSSITVIRPDKLETVMKTGLVEGKIMNAKPFYVENGSDNDVVYSGKYIWLRFKKPGSNQLVKIKTYIMPRDFGKSRFWKSRNPIDFSKKSKNPGI